MKRLATAALTALTASVLLAGSALASAPAADHHHRRDGS